MDYITEMSKNQKEDLQDRLREYNESVLLMSHDGELPELAGFNVVRVTTMVDIILAQRPTVAVLGEGAEELAEVIGKYPMTVGLNIVGLIDVPGQSHNAGVSAWLAAIRDVSYTKILNDIADDQLVKANMTAAELEFSGAKKQMDQIRTKSGAVRPLIDFDRSFAEDDIDAGDK